MVLCEAPDDRVAVNIFGTVAPAHTARYRAGLYHAKGAARTRKGVPIIGIAHKGVNILCIVGVGSLRRAMGLRCCKPLCGSKPLCSSKAL